MREDDPSRLMQYCTPTVPLRKYDPKRQMEMYKIVKVDGLTTRITASTLFNLFNQYGFVVLIKIC